MMGDVVVWRNCMQKRFLCMESGGYPDSAQTFTRWLVRKAPVARRILVL
jgi:hypothetical protein